MPSLIAPTQAQLAELGDELRRDLASPDPRSAAFSGREGYARVAPAAVQPDQVRRWVVGYSPGVAVIGVGGATELLMQCLAHVADQGGGEVHLWREGVRPDDDRAARNVGLEPDRDLLQMRVDLPLSPVEESPSTNHEIVIRDFAVGSDEARWIELNNAAFAGHAEQGDWTIEQLRARTREPWFDPHWFLVAERDGVMVGFNWLRRHPATRDNPETGEIYVIGVGPDAHGLGIGRHLVRAGFERVVAAGISTGELYVASDNAVARALYTSLGFEVTRVDRAYRAHVVRS